MDFDSSLCLKSAGISRDEAFQWRGKGLLRIPPANPAAGRARRYSLAGAFEFALFKALVGSDRINLQHDHAAAVIRNRLDAALKLKGLPAGDYAAFNDPDALRFTEFDVATHLHKPRIVWVIAPTDDLGAPVSSNWEQIPAKDREGGEPSDTAKSLPVEGVLNGQLVRGKALVMDLTFILKQVAKNLTGEAAPLHPPESRWGKPA